MSGSNTSLRLLFALLVTLFISCEGVRTQDTRTENSIHFETLTEGYDVPWSLEVISDSEFLFTERMGALYHYQNGQVSKVKGIPTSQTFKTDRHYGGMMAISKHPQYNSNKLLYLAYVNTDYTLTIVRFRVVNNTAEGLETIFTSNQFSVGTQYRLAE